MRLSSFAVGLLAAVVGVAAVASLMAHSHRVELAERGAGLVAENAALRSEVAHLEARLGRRGGAGFGGKQRAVQGLSQRMQWAKGELNTMRKTQQLVAKTAGVATTPQKTPGEFDPKAAVPSGPNAAVGKAASGDDYWPGSMPWVKTMHNGEQLKAMTTPNGDVNPLSVLKPGDYWKDPYDRPFLHAPNPHDPSSTLAKTVTGDYASPATWGDLYHSKETIDWCTSYFPFFNDRIKCIDKLHASGPLLG
mmetsp:Transcript_46639/g.116844  ORF Transcript_46639/g.116844 Transcript_46639/m.116844 type:complete len:249 (+) Transcript_46639:27-773(+)